MLVVLFVYFQTVSKEVVFIVWPLYSVLIASVFTIIKLVNHSLHRLFDTSDKVEATHGSLHEHDDTNRWVSSLPLLYSLDLF